MANWANPVLTSTYTNFMNELKDRDTDLALQFDGTTSTSLTVGTIRWDSTANRWKKWNGSSWAELTATYALTALSTTGNATIGGILSVTGTTDLAAATATTPVTADNSTAVATTAWVRNQNYAALSGPAFTGTPTAPTAALSTNTTQLATTAFVNAEIANDAPTKTGTGASGTWAIAITGNAATATTLATARTINGVSFNGSANINVPDLRDSNGVVLIDGTGVTSAVNYVSLTNAATAGTVTLATAGSDANIPLQITTKGAGAITIATAGGNIALRPSAGAFLLYDATNAFYTSLDNGTLTANRTLTLPNANVTLVSGTMVPTTGTGATGTWGIGISGNAATATSATSVSGTSTTNINTSALATGTANATTFLRGDRTWTSIPSTADKQTFTSSGTWTKPADATIVYIELWGGGGGGGMASEACGGGGGSFRWAFIQASSLSATESVTVGAGGPGRTGTNGSGVAGGNSTFDDFIAGGGGGGGTGLGNYAGGGGWRGAGSVSTAGAGFYEFGEGQLQEGITRATTRTLWVGAVGGNSNTAGTSSQWGGGGGGGRNSATVYSGGISMFGGDGGDGGGAGAGGTGSVRGGGGGGGAAGTSGGTGGRGEVRVYSW